MYADGIASVTDHFFSRNHTEIMLNYFGAKSLPKKPQHPSDRNLFWKEETFRYLVIFLLPPILSQPVFCSVDNLNFRAGILKVCWIWVLMSPLNESTEGEPTADLLDSHRFL